jgi:hypothetical protein
MVKKVTTPPRISRATVEPRRVISKKRSRGLVPPGVPLVGAAPPEEPAFLPRALVFPEFPP